jgi:adenylate cyclase class 2
VEEEDTFYQHPQRDFTLTDECLRLRRRRWENGKEEKSLTYKGPKIDLETKTRKEIEIPICVSEQWEEMLQVLGFRFWSKIRKFRRQGELQISGQLLNVCLDSLPELNGESFVELEILASEYDWKKKREFLMELSSQLGLRESIRTSYLQLLTRAKSSPPS